MKFVWTRLTRRGTGIVRAPSYEGPDRRAMESNGWRKWGVIFGAVIWAASIIFAAGAMWPKVQAVPEMQRDLRGQGERLTRVETRQEYHTVLLEKIDNRLSRGR